MSSNDVVQVEVGGDASQSDDKVREALTEEAADNTENHVGAVKEKIQSLKGGARSGITGDFGRVQIGDDDVRLFPDSGDKAREDTETKPEPKPEPPGVPVDKASVSEAAKQRIRDAALEFDLRADSYGPAAGGKTSRELKYEEQHRLGKAATPLELAKSRLGAKASPEQLEAYAKLIVQLNSEDKYADIRSTKFEANKTIKLPGQNPAGGIVYKEGDRNVTKWADGSTRVEFEDGAGYLERQNYPQTGEMTKVRWDPNEPENNYEHRVLLKEVAPNVKIPQVLFTESLDAQGRRRLYDYDPTTSAVTRFTVVDLDGAETEFEPTKDDKGEYRAIDDESTRLSKDGRVYTVETKDGDTIERFDDGAVVEIERNENGDETGRTIRETDGRVVKLDDFKPNEEGDHMAHKVTITEPDGDVTRLEYEAVKGWWRGERFDKESGEATEKVRLTWGGKLIYMDSDNPENSRIEDFEWESHDVSNGEPSRYDPNGGKVERDLAGGGSVVESFKPGRTDFRLADGTVSGSTVRGKSSIQATDGETQVVNPDGTRIQLHKDGKVDSWSADGTHTTGELTQPEMNYLANHPDVDRRDIAEIHRKYSGQPEKLNKFYEQLSRIDKAQNLDTAEKRDLRDNILRHVSSPEELYQGRSGTCNVSVIQRDMAMMDPASYAGFIVDTISTGEFTTSKDEKINFDVDNLKLLDSSGRDLASRIFQAAAVQISVWPGEFRNTENGVGELSKEFRGEALDGAVPFPGLKMTEIAQAQTTIQRQNAAVVRIDDVDDLVAAFEASGGEPIIVAINPEAPPFDDNEKPGFETPHVATITKIEKGPPTRVFLQNQYGLEEDHSTPATAVDAEAVVANMQSEERGDGTKYGEVIINGKAIVWTRAHHHEIAQNENGTVEVSAVFEGKIA